MVSQKKMVLDYIREFGSITPLDAFKDLGVTRLAAVIFELKEDGSPRGVHASSTRAFTSSCHTATSAC
jgi:hypothetical protein